MISAQFLEILCCPEDRSRLTQAGPELIERLNAAMAAGRLKNRGGKAIDKRLDGALLRADGQVAYPIIDQIPILLVDEGIRLSDV